MRHLHVTCLLAGFLPSVAGPMHGQEQPASAAAAVPAAVARPGAARCKASQLIGCSITNSKDESLGEIEDIVLDEVNSRIAYAVVSFGGTLGRGEKLFAMPWRVIEIGQVDAEHPPRARIGLDREALESAPGFDRNLWPDMANPTWAGQVDDYYRARSEQSPADGAPEPAGSGVGGQRGGDQAPDSKGFAHRRLTRLIGMDVVDALHQRVAGVEDLVVDAAMATVDGALLSFGGVLGIGEKLVLVPTELLTIDRLRGVMVFACTRAGLEAMVLPDSELPALDTDAWRTGRLEESKRWRSDRHGDKDVTPAEASAVPAGTGSGSGDAYSVDNLETIKGRIATVGSVRLSGEEEPRVRLRVRTTDGREFVVHAAPDSWADQQALQLRAGKRIAVTGSPVRHGDQTVLVAGTIEVGGRSLVLRDDLGRRSWVR